MAPFILKAKQIFQDLCKIKCGWDDAIAETYLTPWKDWLAKLEQLSKVQINRCMKPKNFGKVKQAQMHHFCDASEHGYGSVSYLRLTNKAGEIRGTCARKIQSHIAQANNDPQARASLSNACHQDGSTAEVRT